ncbi:unnamed protein product [Mytilus coruscus]|uniref:Uncharacterized protein n=1 Tax=Mytilus coruscus TaxID=42192 RepID=A0A6J8EVD0_MYTCO|nr:unnamed protein product [Mytilus coruscus]
MEIEQLHLWVRWLELQRDGFIAVTELEEERIKRTRRRRQQRRPLYEQYERLLQELNREDPYGYKNFLRVDADMFGEILNRISHGIELQNTNSREALESGLKLAVFLRHLATGASLAERMYSFRMAKTHFADLPVQGEWVKNAFRILALRFQGLLGCLDQSTDTIDSIILACMTQHNLHRNWNPSIVRQAIDHEDDHTQLQHGEWRQGRQIADGDHIPGRNAVTSVEVRPRDFLMHYFNSPAGSKSVEWQESIYLVQQCNYSYLWFHRKTADVVI